MTSLETTRKLLKAFCARTNIHGFGYIAQPRRATVERLFWLLSIFVSLALTFVLINKLVLESRRNPTVIYTDQNVIHVTDILFPAVSLVPGLILSTPLRPGIDYAAAIDQLQRGSATVHDFRLDELKRLQVASLIARDGLLARHNVSIPTNDFLERLRDFPSMFAFASYSKLNFSNVPDFFFANWSRSCGVNFTEVLCPTGFCYTFNLPDNRSELFDLARLARAFDYRNFVRAGDFLIDHAKLLQRLEHPTKGPANGKGMLLVMYRQYKDRKASKKLFDAPQYYVLNDTVPQRDFFGLPLAFHDPYEVISEGLKMIYTQYGYSAYLKITPKVINYHESLTTMDVEERQCYLPNEKRLRFFNTYNRVNCEQECLSRLTVKFCTCTQFFMVRSERTRICGVADEKCFRKIEVDFKSLKGICKCYENCERVEYEAKMALFKVFESAKGEPKIEIDFAVDKVLPSSRRSHQTATGFLSLVGGFFGLFAGFSFLSGFEILYYFVLEPIFDKFRRVDFRVHPMEAAAGQMSACKIYCRNFFASSSIHGFNHIGDVSKPKIERLTWLLLFTLSMTGSYFMVVQVYRSLQLNQIMMTMEGQATPADKISFPAVTFTDIVRLYSRELTEIEKMTPMAFLFVDSVIELKRRINNPALDTVYNNALAFLCSEQTLTMPMGASHLKFNYTSQLVDFMKKKVSGRKNWKRAQQSTWDKIKRPTYAQTLTRVGFGQTFNMLAEDRLLDLKSLTPDFRYTYGTKLVGSSYPWHTSAGDLKGLVVNVKEFYQTKSCGTTRFAIHASNELPLGVEFNNFIFEHSYEVLITPEVIKADDEFKMLAIGQRQCYFEDERKLKFFKVYTKKNCELECLSHVVYDACRCLPFYYLRNVTQKVCNFRSFTSCTKAYDEIKRFEDFDELFETHGVCKCLPLCNSITINYEVREIENKNSEYKDGEQWWTTLTFRYKDDDFYALLRYQPFKLVDFLSYVGGILGLFAGISVLSIIELAYFFTLRLLSDIWRRF